MWGNICQRIERLASWQSFVLLLMIFILCYLGFEWRHKVLGEQIRTFDARAWYTPVEARDLLEMMGARGRRIYAVTQITLDFIFPFVYGGLLSLSLVKLYPGSYTKYLLLLPALAVMSDLLENVTTAYLAWSYHNQTSNVAWAAAIFTASKRFLIGLSATAVLAGAARLIWRFLRSSV
jgi:hypothetical protein